MNPFRLTTHLVAKPWGGSRLLPDGADASDPIGEAWIVADLDPSQTAQQDAVSRVVGGAHDGASLTDLVTGHRTPLLGPSATAATTRFPLLVKHLDAREHLSVQVHPPAALVADAPRWWHKTESWVIVDADPGAELFLGIRDGVSRTDFATALGTPTVVDLLRRVPALVGDVHHVPSGLVHALGAGVMVAEVQTPSDTTFRVWDWAAYGRTPRELHLDAGWASIAAAWATNTTPSTVLHGDGVLVDTDDYVLARCSSDTEDRRTVPTRPSVRVVLVIRGEVALDGLDGGLRTGDCAVVPAAWSGELSCGAGTTWLEVDAPVG